MPTLGVGGSEKSWKESQKGKEACSSLVELGFVIARLFCMMADLTDSHKGILRTECN